MTSNFLSCSSLASAERNVRLGANQFVLKVARRDQTENMRSNLAIFFSLYLSVCAAARIHLPQIPLHSNNDAPQSTLISASLTSYLLDLHRDLIQIQSITGNEHRVGVWLQDWLRRQGLHSTLQCLPEPRDKHNPAQDTSARDEPAFAGAAGRCESSQRCNVYAQANPTANPKILLTSHIDTVPPFYPYKTNATSSPNAEDGRSIEIWGRGSADAKASIAAQLTAYHDLVHQDQSRSTNAQDIAFLYVVGEETGGDGMKFFSASELHRSRNFSAVVFGEPSMGRLISGHKGLLQLIIRAKGRAAHSGYPWLGVSANTLLTRALAAVEDLVDEDKEGGLPWTEKFGNTTVNVGKISGGVAANVIPEEAHADLAIRIAGGEPADTTEIIREAVKRATAPLIERRGGNVEVKQTITGYPTVDIDTDIPGFGDPLTINCGTDVPNLESPAGKRYKKYLYGPGRILVAHSDHEEILQAELEEGVKGYERIIKELLSRERESRMNE